MSEVICPACGSGNVTKVKSEKSLSEPFGGHQKIELTDYSCDVCGCVGDFSSQNEVVVKQCLSELKHEAIMNILNEFSELGYSFSEIERALELPQRTLTKWKNNVVSPTAAANSLMKFVHLFPWLLEVAENKYDYQISQRIHVGDAIQKFITNMNFCNTSLKQTGIVSSDDSTLCWFHFHKSEEGADLKSTPPADSLIPTKQLVTV